MTACGIMMDVVDVGVGVDRTAEEGTLYFREVLRGAELVCINPEYVEPMEVPGEDGVEISPWSDGYWAYAIYSENKIASTFIPTKRLGEMKAKFSEKVLLVNKRPYIISGDQYTGLSPWRDNNDV